MEIARYFRTVHQRMRLQGVICKECGEKLFPPKQVHIDCPKPKEIYNSTLLSPNNKVVHGEVVRQDQK